MQIVNDQLIKKWEKLRLVAYLPTTDDVWTIGWGHTHAVKQGMRITEQQAQTYFDQDTAWVENAISTHVKVALTQHQYDALASFIFNLGTTNFKNSTLLRKLNAGDYEGAAHQLPRWNKQKRKVLRGLVRRRAEEMEYFLQPDDAPTTRNVDPVVEPSLLTSKEIIGGITASLTGLGALLGSLAPEAQAILSVTLSVVIMAIGGFFVWNRLKARQRGER